MHLSALARDYRSVSIIAFIFNEEFLLKESLFIQKPLAALHEFSLVPFK
jgi:hypothetical protein